MPEHPNVALIRGTYEATDITTLMGFYAEDMAWHWLGSGPLCGDYKGRDAVLAVFGRIQELCGGTFRIEVHDVMANDEHAVALTRWTASRQGKRLDVLDTDVYHVKDGNVVEFWSFVGDQRRDAEFWSD